MIKQILIIAAIGLMLTASLAGPALAWGGYGDYRYPYGGYPFVNGWSDWTHNNIIGWTTTFWHSYGPMYRRFSW